MDVSPLWRLLIVAALAYSSGLLVGLSYLRGEIGPRRPAVREPPATETQATRTSAAPRRSRSRSRLKRWAEGFGDTRRRATELAVITLWLVGIGVLLLWLVSSLAHRAYRF
jgi:hypothetical protein